MRRTYCIVERIIALDDKVQHVLIAYILYFEIAIDKIVGLAHLVPELDLVDWDLYHLLLLDGAAGLG